MHDVTPTIPVMRRNRRTPEELTQRNTACLKFFDSIKPMNNRFLSSFCSLSVPEMPDLFSCRGAAAGCAPTTTTTVDIIDIVLFTCGTTTTTTTTQIGAIMGTPTKSKIILH